jgi:uncharacterized protein YbcI
VELGGLPEQTLSTGEIAAAISNAIVRIYTEQHGRGPTRAKTHLFDDVILTVMEESAVTVERTLAEAGEEELVQTIRSRVQGTVADQLRASVEEITGRRVRAFLSATEVDPDVKCDVFLLEPEAERGE